MGEALRRYWIPALLSEELPEADAPPVRVKLLGEDLLAFRDTSGRVGLMDELCPHRLASLWLGRNEENGLRCVYHGWKFDVTGQCVEQMNEPESFAHKIAVKAYPTQEMGGIVWTYMGPAAKQPPAPKFEWTQVAESHRAVTKVWQECNWLQALEGGIDTSHAPILHRQLREGARAAGIQPSTPFVRGKAPTLEVDVTDYGYRYTGIRQLGTDEQYVRGYHFVMPFTQLRPSQIGRGGDADRHVVSGHFWVPIDDGNTMVWNWHYSFGPEGLTEEERSMDSSGNGRDHVDWANEFRSKASRRNNWLIDRDIQKTDTFTGIPGINTQDRAVQESMGAIVDRTREHLGPADKAIITTRQLLMKAARTVLEGGEPQGANSSYYHIRAIEKVFSAATPWREVLLPEMYPDQQRELVGAR
jgi:phenylpropionate dioxygenase-like ring-hydroxylating dioxygenase large terminal subunit